MSTSQLCRATLKLYLNYIFYCRLSFQNISNHYGRPCTKLFNSKHDFCTSCEKFSVVPNRDVHGVSLDHSGIKISRNQKSRDLYFWKILVIKNLRIFRMDSRDQKIPGLKFSKNPGTKKCQKSRPVHTSTRQLNFKTFGLRLRDC